MDGEELLVRYARGERDFRGTDLQDADLQGADLRGANLRGADLQDADLRGANLRDANLRDADLQVARLWVAILQGVDLFGADLRGAELHDAILQGAFLRGADLHGADLRGADLQAATLWDANLRDADLRGADLRGTELRGANLRGTDLHGADLRGAKLFGAHLIRTRLHEVRHAAGLEGATVDWLTVAMSLDIPAPELVDILTRTGMPAITATYMVESLRSIDAADLFTMLQSVFLSYGEDDRVFAERLRNDLSENGVKMWWAPHDSLPGRHVGDELAEHVRSYDRVILLCSRDSLARPWVVHELELTLEREALEGVEVLIPVALDDVLETRWAPRGRGKLEDALGERVHADFRDAVYDVDKYNAALHKVLLALRKREEERPTDAATREAVEQLSPTRALEKLLLDLFTKGELRWFVARVLPDLRHAVNWDQAMGTVVFELVGALERRGQVDARLFEALRTERHARVEDIHRVEALW